MEAGLYGALAADMAAVGEILKLVAFYMFIGYLVWCLFVFTALPTFYALFSMRDNRKARNSG